MVINAPIEFYHAKKKFDEARTPKEKLQALYNMLKTAPKHKGAHNLLVWITKQIAKYKEIVEKEKRKKGKRKPLIQKTGDLLISILGVENSGKSYFLKMLTNASVGISEVPYSTIKPVIGVKKYKGVLYQFVEIPATFETEFRSILSISNYYIIILKPENLEEQLNAINEFAAGIAAFSLEGGPNYTIIINKYDDFKDIDVDNLLEIIIKKLGLIRVFPVNSDRAVLLEKGSTVKNFIEKLNESWLDKFVFAKIIRGGKKVRVGLNYLLEDMDIVELKLKG
ncbi:MAG TPA: TGS domain-containing protein [Candidatus Nanopusillus sp.]|nr:TGS domain-containing protein [Candidatus Nanopusillus sp.]